ncbi:NAD(P)-dependent dehydrogenase (short-subunit alcohol dehydrogenase family) [Catenuloplanes nepalensis]|uniref:NAD(P)-dependent dehydrogenase (Short-subunit alcohol dehydrogenase family) n=1 Tax=Catenuloplanes nepalensis TaxID=587533 RepID=A0ABT9MTI3_9ACTN|nr:SDR family oxidoreductase [Catenuloplanes nepalensis]MDP9794752.1 NAD(P)-dependent dehydrogenase (short-subunit alcohol dehydrogenase family) [Catenuloplanes nepalensis]
MQIKGATALVTGANRGIGRHLAAQLVGRGAKVYAAARRPETVDFDGVVPIALDITDTAAVETAARTAGDVDLLVNNTGINTFTPLLGDLDRIHADMNTNLWGTLSMVRGFAPVLAANGGGAVVTIASGTSWMAMPDAGTDAVSKAAVWNMSNGLRWELAGQGTSVISVHLGCADTGMGDGPLEKGDPPDVARATLDGIERDDWEVIVDDQAALVKEWLSKDPKAVYALVSQLIGA